MPTSSPRSHPPHTSTDQGAGGWFIPKWVLAALLVVMVFAPALVANAVTGPAQPEGFLTHPWRGWQLLGTVISDAPGSPTPSPGSALEHARLVVDDATLDPQRAELVYVASDDQLTVERFGDARHRSVGVSVDGPLVWVIDGTRRGTRGTGVLAVVDYATGDLRYELSVADPTQESNAR